MQLFVEVDCVLQALFLNWWLVLRRRAEMAGFRSKRELLKTMDDENIISSPSIQSRRRPRSGDASQPESRYSSLPAYYGTKRHRPLGLLSQRCLRGERVVPRHSTKGRPLLSPTINCFLVLSLLVAWLRLGTSLDEIVGLPEWIPLTPEGRAGENAVAELFGSGEVLQMFHLQVPFVASDKYKSSTVG